MNPTPDHVVELGIARTFQNIRLWKSMTVFENVLVAKNMRAKQNVFSATFRLNRKEEARMREEAAALLEELCRDIKYGARPGSLGVKDELLATVACKAAIKAGWVSDDKELLAIVKEVMAREDLKYCPHGRPICVSLSKKQLEKQFKRV